MQHRNPIKKIYQIPYSVDESWTGFRTPHGQTSSRSKGAFWFRAVTKEHDHRRSGLHRSGVQRKSSRNPQRAEIFIRKAKNSGAPFCARFLSAWNQSQLCQSKAVVRHELGSCRSKFSGLASCEDLVYVIVQGWLVSLGSWNTLEYFPFPKKTVLSIPRHYFELENKAQKGDFQPLWL